MVESKRESYRLRTVVEQILAQLICLHDRNGGVWAIQEARWCEGPNGKITLDLVRGIRADEVCRRCAWCTPSLAYDGWGYRRVANRRPPCGPTRRLKVTVPIDTIVEIDREGVIHMCENEKRHWRVVDNQGVVQSYEGRVRFDSRAAAEGAARCLAKQHNKIMFVMDAVAMLTPPPPQDVKYEALDIGGTRY